MWMTVRVFETSLYIFDRADCGKDLIVGAGVGWDASCAYLSRADNRKIFCILFCVVIKLGISLLPSILVVVANDGAMAAGQTGMGRHRSTLTDDDWRSYSVVSFYCIVTGASF